MASYTIVIPDEQESCIDAARKAYNLDQPQTVPDPDNPEQEIPNPALKADNAAYMAFVMQNAAKSYCNQYPLHGLVPDGPAPTPAPTAR